MRRRKNYEEEIAVKMLQRYVVEFENDDDVSEQGRTRFAHSQCLLSDAYT